MRRTETPSLSLTVQPVPPHCLQSARAIRDYSTTINVSPADYGRALSRMNLRDDTALGRFDFILHLHGFHHEQPLARLHFARPLPPAL